MSPLVKRSWAPTGKTPVLYQRTRSHRKVSVIAALCVNPERNRISLYFRLHPDANIRTRPVKDFLRHLGRQVKGPIVLVWDRFLPHRARVVQGFLQTRSNTCGFFFPSYAPELNPGEGLWGYLKMNPMANFTPMELQTLTAVTRQHSRSVQRKQHLLYSFIRKSHLPLRINRTLFM